MKPLPKFWPVFHQNPNKSWPERLFRSYIKSLTDTAMPKFLTLFISRGLIFLVSGLPGLVLAQQDTQADTSEPDFWPSAEMRTGWDWIQMDSGEWLKGDIISLYERELEFDSDKMGDQTFDWSDLISLVSHKTYSVQLDDGRLFTGLLELRDDTFTIGQTAPIQVNPVDIISIAPVGSGFGSLVTGKITLSADLNRGNTHQRGYTLLVNAERRTAKTRNIVTYQSQYSELDDSRVEDNQRFTGSWDWFFSRYWFFRPANVEYMRDEFQNIDYRWTYTSALGYYLIDNNKTTWDAYTGPGYQETRFATVQADRDRKESTYVWIIGSTYSTELTSDIDFDTSYDVYFVSEDAGSVIQHAEVGISIDFLSDFSLDARWIWDNVQDPTPDETGQIPKQTDVQVILGLSYDF